ncbi:MAG: hypothetical protein Q7T55_03025 [Solirubrobacteraceae bacterium]|nr:hypothetical protein [Solirubrobacteraceae bacterium]
MIAADYNAFPGILQMLAGATVLIALGGLGLRHSLRTLRGAARTSRWQGVPSALWSLPFAGAAAIYGTFLLLALPTAELHMTVERIDSTEGTRHGRPTTKHIVTDTQGRSVRVTDEVLPQVYYGQVFRCRIHRAIIIGVRTGNCQPS